MCFALRLLEYRSVGFDGLMGRFAPRVWALKHKLIKMETLWAFKISHANSSLERHLWAPGTSCQQQSLGTGKNVGNGERK